MAIGNAIIKNDSLIIYDDNGKQLANIAASRATLNGYTSTSVTITKDRSLITYDMHGKQISNKSI